MEQFGKSKSKRVAMNNFLSIVLFVSLSLANTSYIVFGSDVDDNSDIKSFGYNHNVVKLNKFGLALGGDYSANLSGDSYFNSYDNLDLASIYLLPSFRITNKVAIWSSIGFSLVTNDSDIESLCSQGFPDSSSDNPSGWEGTTEDCELSSGLSYGFGLHYILGDKFGIGARYISQPLELTSYEGKFTYEDMERINVYLSYQF